MSLQLWRPRYGSARPGADPLPTQRSLGLLWNASSDSFGFDFSTVSKPPTRRGVLSSVNIKYDPSGFMASVIVRGKMLLRELGSVEWDSPVPRSICAKWETWVASFHDARTVTINRCYVPRTLELWRLLILSGAFIQLIVPTWCCCHRWFLALFIWGTTAASVRQLLYRDVSQRKYFSY